tara:strand:- start:5963 stop:7378 length:1416 start_codon:yes stop_codon:yes gene_type:complete
MNKTTVVVILILATALIFIIATLVVNKSFDNENNPAQVDIKNLDLDLDCSGVWEDSPICKERKNAFIALQNLDRRMNALDTVVQESNTNNYNQAKVSKREGDKFLREEFYFKAENKYKEALNILNKLDSDFTKKIKELKNKAKYEYDKNNLKKANEIFLELQNLINDSEIEEYILKIQYRSQILEYNLEAKENLSKNKFEIAREKNEEALLLDNQFKPTLNLKLEIIEKEKQFYFIKALEGFYGALDNNSFTEARVILKKAAKIIPDSDELIQAKNILMTKERKFLISKYVSEKNQFIKLESWSEAINSLNKLKKINSSIIDNSEEEYLLNTIKFYKLWALHKNQPKRLSSKDVFNEITNNYKLGKKLSNSETKILNKDLLEMSSLIDQYSKRIVIKFSSDNETYLDILRFKNFNPFEEFSISVRPGEYTFVAKKPGIESLIKKYDISPNMKVLHLYISCDISCKIREING